MKQRRNIFLVVIAAGLGVGVFLLQQKWQQPVQPRVELKVSLEDQQTAMVRTTDAASGLLAEPPWTAAACCRFGARSLLRHRNMPSWITPSC